MTDMKRIMLYQGIQIRWVKTNSRYDLLVLKKQNCCTLEAMFVVQKGCVSLRILFR